MATYKKRGYKPKKEHDISTDSDNLETFDESQSAVAETFNALDETANKSEQWIEKNSKPLFYGLIAVAALILIYLAYNKFVVSPKNEEASNELAHPRLLFNEAMVATGAEADSLFTLGLNGGVNGKYGFIDIADTYSNTKAGNLANYYAGISYLKMKQYKEAIEYLSKFDSEDKVLGPVAVGAIGDAFADINQLEDALTYYEKAANKQDNAFTTPLFLFKAGQTAMQLNEYSKAEALFRKIKEKYAKSDQGRDIEKYISGAQYAQ